MGWMNVSLSGRAAGFMHFLLHLHVVAVVEGNDSEPNELRSFVSPARPLNPWHTVPVPTLIPFSKYR